MLTWVLILGSYSRHMCCHFSPAPIRDVTVRPGLAIKISFWYSILVFVCVRCCLLSGSFCKFIQRPSVPAQAVTTVSFGSAADKAHPRSRTTPGFCCSEVLPNSTRSGSRHFPLTWVMCPLSREGRLAKATYSTSCITARTCNFFQCIVPCTVTRRSSGFCAPPLTLSACQLSQHSERKEKERICQEAYTVQERSRAP